MQAPQSWIKGYFLVGMIAALSACGGGSSSSSSPPPPDTTPNAFSFTAVEDAELDADVPSNTITIRGINTETPISVQGGEYRIDGGDYTDSDGTIESGQSVQVRANASPEFDTDVEAVLTIGGVEGSFTVTTVANLVPAVATFDTDLGIREDIVVTFSEPMNTSSLDISGLLVELAAAPTWNDDNTQLTLTPNGLPSDPAAWESGLQTITGTVNDLAGNTTDLDMDFEIRLVFGEDQPATAVIGQAGFYEGDPNRDGAPGSNTLEFPVGRATATSDRLWVPDFGNNRSLGFDVIPESESEDVSAIWVLGQEDPNSGSASRDASATTLSLPTTTFEYETRFYSVSPGDNRIVIYDGIHTAFPVEASGVIGQSDLDRNDNGQCSDVGLDFPTDMQIVDDKLIVADTGNNRVLIWNTVPSGEVGVSGSADLVLGNTLGHPKISESSVTASLKRGRSNHLWEWSSSAWAFTS